MTSFSKDSLDRLAAPLPAWRAEQMRAAFKVFEGLNEPTGTEEDWRYVDFTTPFESLSPVFEPGHPLTEGPFLTAVGKVAGRVTIIDGRVVEVDSPQIAVTRISEMDEDPGLRGAIPPDHNKLTAAHLAFAVDGVLIDIPANQVFEHALVVDVQGVTPDTASFPHLVVRLGENAEVPIMVVYRSVTGARLLMVPEVDLRVGDGARLKFLSVQGSDQAATVVVHQRVHLGRDASSSVGEVGLGGKLARLDLGVDLEGDGSSSEVVGLYFGEGEQTLDYRVVVNHRGRRTSSDVFLKGAVEDSAQSVFTGLLRIEKEAARTSTFETNRNLVLSENAKAQSVPNLEILCDDVVCGHASSVGPLEQEHRYYLQSRGLSKARAERLLIRGFFQEVIDRLPIEGVGEPVSTEVFSRFVAAQEAGRVA
ncbi:MAG TPA: Fe-S cluster assembly protein SufD [Acidimicrobiia bacterium]